LSLNNIAWDRRRRVATRHLHLLSHRAAAAALCLRLWHYEVGLGGRGKPEGFLKAHKGFRSFLCWQQVVAEEDTWRLQWEEDAARQLHDATLVDGATQKF
jgi:hypothetical protein